MFDFRYLLVEVIFGAGGGAKNVCSDSDIFQAVMRKVELIHGDFGWSSVRSSFQVKVCDAGMCIAILRIASTVSDLITSSLPFVLSIGSSDAVLRTLSEGKFFLLLVFDQTRNYYALFVLGSSMRTVEKRLIDFNLKALYAQLGRDPTPGSFSQYK